MRTTRTSPFGLCISLSLSAISTRLTELQMHGTTQNQIVLSHKKSVMNRKEIKLVKEKNFFQVLRDKKSVKDFEEEGISGIEIE